MELQSNFKDVRIANWLWVCNNQLKKEKENDGILLDKNNINTNAIIPVSSQGAKKIPSLCSEQAVRSHTVNVIARSVATRQSQPFFMRLPRFARNDTGTGLIASPFQGSQWHCKNIYCVYISIIKGNRTILERWIEFKVE